MNRHGIISTLHGRIKEAGGEYGQWFVGLCASTGIDDHIPREAIESLLINEAECIEDARAVVAYFVYIYETVRADTIGEPGECRYIYAYHQP